MSRYHLRKEAAKNIRELRIRADLTQEEAADHSGFHYKYYQKIESGTVNLTLDSIEKLAKVFGVHPKRLF